MFHRQAVSGGPTKGFLYTFSRTGRRRRVLPAQRQPSGASRPADTGQGNAGQIKVWDRTASGSAVSQISQKEPTSWTTDQQGNITEPNLMMNDLLHHMICWME